MNFEHGGNVHRFLRAGGGALEALLDFSANINPLGMSPLGEARMRESFKWLLHYPDPAYVALRRALAGYYGCDLKDLSVFNGGAEGLHELFRYLKPGSVLMPAPTFVEYEKALAAENSEIHWHVLKAEDGFAVDASAFLEQLGALRPDLVVLCSPNNPTGRLVPGSLIREILSLISDWNGRLVVDEAFYDFLEPAVQNDNTALNWTKACRRLYVLKSFTKFFGVPGLRLGAVISEDEAFHQHIEACAVPWRVNAMAESYALGALKDEAYIKASREAVSAERRWLCQALEQFKGICVIAGEADYLLFALEDPRAEVLLEKLAERRIMIRSCANYRGLGKHYFRIAVKEHAANLRLIAALDEVLK